VHFSPSAGVNDDVVTLDNRPYCLSMPNMNHEEVFDNFETSMTHLKAAIKLCDRSSFSNLNFSWIRYVRIRNK
jgi:hypothetical protein